MTTTTGKWFEIDSKKGQVYLVGAATRELAFEYHDKGYIALEANLGFEDGKTISFSQGGNTVTATDDENGFFEDDIGKYIYTGDGWHKILSVSDVTIVGCGKNLLPPQTTQTKSGVTIMVQDDGGVHISGTCTAASGPVTFEYPVNMTLDGEFTLSMGNSQAVADHLQMRLTDGPGATLYDAHGTSSNITAQSANSSVPLELDDQYVYGWLIRVGGGESYDVTIYPQLEAGDTATAFEPYEDIPFISIDNAQGQIESVAVEAGCRARQAGTGDPSPENIRAITAHESVEIAACGKNLYDVNDRRTFSDGVTVDADGWITVTADNSAGSGIIFKNCFTYPSIAIRPSTQYAVVCEIAQINVSGTLDFRITDTLVDAVLSQFAQAFSLSVNENTQTGTRIQVLTSRADLSDAGSMLRTYIGFAKGASGTIKFRLSVLADIAITAETFEYEPYASMGGGTVTPAEPLWGLSGAEDTVEVSTDGDVTVTRRTAVLELDGTEDWLGYGVANGYIMYVYVPAIKQISSTYTIANMVCSHYPTIAFYKLYTGSFNAIGQSSNSVNISCVDSRFQSVSAWKSYLAAQAAAGTPVTIVYELAAPETEALTAISPITPVPGQLNLATDADALTATIHGSGWETVNDTSSIQDALANLDGDLASLINEVGLLNGEVGSIAQQIISPDGIKNIVFESSEYQAMANTVEINANELSVTQATVTDINGRVETIEGTVRISGSNIDIGRSDSNVQLHLDNEGWSISEGGQETIYARQNRVVAPRFQTTSLIFGALAFNSSGGHFRLMKYGG